MQIEWPGWPSIEAILLSSYSLKGSRQAWRSPSLPDGPPRGIQDFACSHSLLVFMYVSLAQSAQTHENLIMPREVTHCSTTKKRPIIRTGSGVLGSWSQPCSSRRKTIWKISKICKHFCLGDKMGNKMSLRYFPPANI